MCGCPCAILHLGGYLVSLKSYMGRLDGFKSPTLEDEMTRRDLRFEIGAI